MCCASFLQFQSPAEHIYGDDDDTVVSMLFILSLQPQLTPNESLLGFLTSQYFNFHSK